MHGNHAHPHQVTSSLKELHRQQLPPHLQHSTKLKSWPLSLQGQSNHSVTTLCQPPQHSSSGAIHSKRTSALDRERERLLRSHDWVGISHKKPVEVHFLDAHDRDLIGKRRRLSRKHHESAPRTRTIKDRCKHSRLQSLDRAISLADISVRIGSAIDKGPENVPACFSSVVNQPSQISDEMLEEEYHCIDGAISKPRDSPFARASSMKVQRRRSEVQSNHMYTEDLNAESSQYAKMQANHSFTPSIASETLSSGQRHKICLPAMTVENEPVLALGDPGSRQRQSLLNIFISSAEDYPPYTQSSLSPDQTAARPSTTRSVDIPSSNMSNIEATISIADETNYLSPHHASRRSTSSRGPYASDHPRDLTTNFVRSLKSANSSIRLETNASPDQIGSSADQGNIHAESRVPRNLDDTKGTPSQSKCSIIATSADGQACVSTKTIAQSAKETNTQQKEQEAELLWRSFILGSEDVPNNLIFDPSRPPSRFQSTHLEDPNDQQVDHPSAKQYTASDGIDSQRRPHDQIPVPLPTSSPPSAPALMESPSTDEPPPLLVHSNSDIMLDDATTHPQAASPSFPPRATVTRTVSPCIRPAISHPVLPIEPNPILPAPLVLLPAQTLAPAPSHSAKPDLPSSHLRPTSENDSLQQKQPPSPPLPPPPQQSPQARQSKTPPPPPPLVYFRPPLPLTTDTDERWKERRTLWIGGCGNEGRLGKRVRKGREKGKGEEKGEGEVEGDEIEDV